MKRSDMSLLRSVVVLAADEKYLPHARSTLVNCRRQGKWTEDFCLILPPEVDAEFYRRRGIYVLTDPAPSYYRKFALFDPSFNRTYQTEWNTPEQLWDTVLYMDEDVLVQAPLEPLLHEGSWGTIVADREMFSLEHAFTHWAKPEDLARPEVAGLLQELRSGYDLRQPQYTTAVMKWHPRAIPADARQRLADLAQRLAPINTHVGKGTDQPIINLAFQGAWEHVRSDLFCYWRNAWDGTIVVHYCSGYATWIKKTPKMGAYWNDKLGRPCYDLYQENLAAFEEEFPER